MPLENIFLVLALTLLFAKLFGELAERAGLASLVGELSAGILLGPVLGLIFIDQNSFMEGFLTIAVMFVLFLAGLRVKFDDVRKHIYSASALAFMGGFLSFLFGFLVGLVFLHNVIVAFAIGAVIISSSDITLFAFLTKSGMYNSKIGKMIIATTIADDIVGIVFLSLLFALLKSQELVFGTVFQLFLVTVGFYLIIFTVGSKIMDRVLNVTGKFVQEVTLFTVPVAVAFFLGYVTENIGIGMAVGAFLAGMAIANSQYSENVITPKITIMARGFVEPVLYAVVGASLVLNGINIPMTVGIMLAAVLGKVIGIGMMSRFFGIKGRSAEFFGIAMIPRGNDNIALVQIVLLLGIITLGVYSSVVLAMIATILITPILSKIFCRM